MAGNGQQNEDISSSPFMAICPHKNPCHSSHIEKVFNFTSFDQIKRLIIPCGLIKKLPPRQQKVAIRFMERICFKNYSY